VTVAACPRVLATVTNGPIRSAYRKSDLSRHLLPITKRSFWPGSPCPQILREVVPVRSGATGAKAQQALLSLPRTGPSSLLS
jgi:hypothetical protein